MKENIKKLTKNNIDLNDNDISFNIKLRGYKSQFYLFNYIKLKITNKTIDDLINLSNLNSNYIKLKKDIDELLRKDLKKLLNRFLKNDIKLNELNFYFDSFINYDKYNIAKEQIYDYIIFKFLSFKYELKTEKSVKCIEQDYNKYIFSDLEIDKLKEYIDYKFESEDEFIITISNIVNDKTYLVKMFSLNPNQDYNTNFNFPIIENWFDKISFYDYIFNYQDIQPKFSYPILPNNVVIPFCDRKYNNTIKSKNVKKYGNATVSTYQQIETSTSTHSFYLYRKARFKYCLNKDFILDDFLKLYMIKYNLLNNEKNIKSIINYFNNEKDYKNNELNEIINFISNLIKLSDVNKENLIEKLKNIYSDEFLINELINNIIIVYDLDANNNSIPIYYKIENDKKVYIFDIEKKDEYFETNFLVAKTIENVDILKENNLEEVLNNDFDFPIEKGLYDIETPKNIYCIPQKSNISKKGVTCNDGYIYYDWMKKYKILYIPDYYLKKSEKIEINDEFLVPDGREISGFPALAFSYIIIPMSIKDKINYIKFIIKEV